MLDLNFLATETRTTFFAEVVIPLAVQGTFTYRIPLHLNGEVATGKRVIVSFNRNKMYAGIVAEVHAKAPTLYEAKYILSVLDDGPLVLPVQLALWRWMASYYMCYLGEVMQAALPSALKMESETRILLNKEVFIDEAALNEKELLIIRSLETHNEQTIKEIGRLHPEKDFFSTLKLLIKKDLIRVYEEVNERSRPQKKTLMLRLSDRYLDKRSLESLFGELERAPKQLNVLMAYLALRKEDPKISQKAVVEKSGSGPAIIHELIKKGVFVAEASRALPVADLENAAIAYDLSLEQQAAFAQINTLFKEKTTVLLHGVTSSGKTQVYVKLIEDVLLSGRQVLYLLPEIALTSQLIARLQIHFKETIAVYHSRFNENERATVWEKVLSGQCRMVLGARSSIFLPFSDLGFVIVDEEHEPSFKQFDPAPRYHARDTALYLASLHGAKVLLGSATPSFESYHNATTRKYGLVSLKNRFGGVAPPIVTLIDIRKETREKTMKGHYSEVLFKAIDQALLNNQQSILFQNRRGYAPLIQCGVCAYIPKCIHCDVTLTLHKHSMSLVCHYCGYKIKVIDQCPVCGNFQMQQKGFGTEKIEEELGELFPNAKVARMDADTTRNKNAHSKILSDFATKKTNVLIGTQMITKGLDFDGVILVGIVNVDSMIYFPDFRAHERSFQLIGQVGGRAGRRADQGTVYIQTFDTTHRIFRYVEKNDFEGFFKDEMRERERFHYPPFFKMVRIDLKHKEPEILNTYAPLFGQMMQKTFGAMTLGPEDAIVSKVRNYYIKNVFLKIDKDHVSYHKIKNLLKLAIDRFQKDFSKGKLKIQIDVDPV